MSIKLSTIDDPKLRARIIKAIDDADLLRRELKEGVIIDTTTCSKTKKKRIRQDTKPLMNKLEQEYFERFLEDSEPNVCIQAIRFKLANGVWYKVDFFVGYASKPVAIEVKGPHAFRGGFENIKMAAHQYPWIKWVLVWKDNGVWQEQTILP